MSNELVLLPKSQYAALLGKQSGSDDVPAESPPATEKPAVEHSPPIPIPASPPSPKQQPAHGTDLPVDNVAPSKSSDESHSEQVSAASGDAGAQGNSKPGQISPGDSDTGDNSASSKTIEKITTPGDSKIENSLLLKFKANDQKYIRNIISACEKHPDILDWNSDGVIKVKGTELQGSDIFELLSDTLTDRKNPVGKLLIYQALAQAGITSKDIKNRNNKAFFNAVNGKKPAKKSSSAATNEGGKRKAEAEAVSSNDTEKKTENSPPKRQKMTWITWK